MGTRSSRERMIDSAIALMQRNGAAAVTVDAVLADSGAPRGSVYYHFPGGRDQLRVDAVSVAGAVMTTMVDAAAGLDPRDAIGGMRDYWAERLAKSDFTEGCPVTGAAIGGAELDPELHQAAAAVFDSWHVALAHGLMARGMADSRAKSLSTMIVAGFEGALVLARMRRSVDPLNEVAAELQHLAASALEQ